MSSYLPWRNRRPPTIEQVATVIMRGAELAQVRAMPGWSHVLDIAERRVKQAEFDLINATSWRRLKLVALQNRCRAFRELFEQMQLEIDVAIKAGEDAKLPPPPPTLYGVDEQ